jgi:aminoglycoside 6'-N-acetyltransferase
MLPNPTVYSIRLRNAPLFDLDTLVAWDAKEHVRNCVHNGNESNDDDVKDDEWDWAYELPRTSLSWRHLLIAELLDSTTPIGMLQIIDPALEETHYWGVDCPPRFEHWIFGLVKKPTWGRGTARK